MKIFINKVFKNYFLMMITLMGVELIFRGVMHFPFADWALLRIFLGINIVSLLLGSLYSFCGRIAGNVLTFITTLVFSVYAIAQAGFENYLGMFMSFGTSSQAGAVADYFKDYIESFQNSYYLMFIPCGVLILYYLLLEHRVHIIERNSIIDFTDKFDSEEKKEEALVTKTKRIKKFNFSARVNACIVAIVFAGMFYATLEIPFMQNKIQLKSTKSLMINPDMPNIAVGQFGITGYGLVDIKSTILPVEEMNDEYQTFKKATQVHSDYTRYIDDTEWETIISDESNNNYKTLSNYFISQEITDKNDYTGVFADKNLIVIMMESTSNVFINKEYYPNIYRLYNEGWTWTNAYSPRNSCSTGNNEMSGMTSLYTINNMCTVNIYKDNKYPESLFNLFNNSGYETTSYHNYTEQYYARRVIHPNMGSGHYYGVQELGIPYSNQYREWPSDVALMDKVLENIEGKDHFMTWITTVSSHQPYGVDSELGVKNLSMFDNTDYDITLKRYMSKLKELDDAIGELIEGLEEQGQLDDTVIVMFADHYPYGLKDNVLNGYYDYDVSVNNEVDRTPFIIYNPKLKATKHEEYTTFMNIVPTVANLYGLDYDPRLYVGKDILSKSYVSRAYFADGSWQDEKAFYNATTGKIEYSGDEMYSAEEIQAINKSVNDKIKMSNLAIKTNYFSYLDEKLNPVKDDVKDGNKDDES